MGLNMERRVSIPGGTYNGVFSDDGFRGCYRCGERAAVYSRRYQGWVWISCGHCGHVYTAIQPELTVTFGTTIGNMASIILTMSWEDVDKMLYRAFGVKDVIKESKNE